jgi:hypothetical protein
VSHDSHQGGGSRGTGSARRRAHDSVGVAQLTPPPDPRRTDREALARRRTAQLEAALLLARTLVEQKQLDDALDACQQALTLDESHLGALQLEEEIQTAIRIRDGVESAANEGALTAADGPTMDPGLAGSKLLESQAVTRYHEDAFAYTGPPSATPEQRQTKTPAPVAKTPLPTGLDQPVSDHTAIRLPAVPVDATIIAPAHRAPSPAAPASPTAPAPPAPAVAKTPDKPASSSKVVAKKVDPPGFLAAAGQWCTSALQSIGPALSGVGQTLRGSATPAAQKNTQKKTSPLVWAGVGVGVLAVVGVGAYLLTRGPVPTGTTVIEAVPWATVVAVRNERGESQTLPSPASTPMMLALPAGTYQITLTGPPPELKTETVSVLVEVGRTAVVLAPRFPSVTVEEYFEQYIGAGDAQAPEPTAETPAVTATPAAAPATTGGVQ